MREKIYNFYLNKGTFLFFSVAALVLWLAWGVAVLLTGNPIKLAVFALVFFVLTAGMLAAYIKGETNIQKMLFGSLIVFLIVDYIELVDVYIQYNLTELLIINSIVLVLMVIFFICHMLQQLDHVGKGIIQLINQCCGFAVVLSAVALGYCVASGIVTATDYTFLLAVMFTLLLIICMETRISRYKQLRAAFREKGEWNEQNRAEAKKLFKI